MMYFDTELVFGIKANYVSLLKLKKIMKKTFKNKAEEMAYLLAPREIERKTGKDGKTYRIFDDGNFKTMHLFTIEVSLGTLNGTTYWDKVSKVYVDWKDVSTEFATL